MKKVLLLEFNDFHEEVLLSQLNFLSSAKKEIYLGVNKLLLKKVNFNIETDKILVINNKNKVTKLLSILKIIKFINYNKINIVVFNTYESIYVKLLSKFINIKKIAIVHNLDIFSSDNNIIKFLVLNKTLLNYAKSKFVDDFDYFYPIFNYKSEKNKKVDKKIRIVIPGLVELSRRDYIGFLNAVKAVKSNNLEFILLGNILKNDGLLVFDKIKEFNLEDKIKIYKGFIPYEEYFSVISSSDLIMPLIHPNVENFKKYHTTKITAAFTMAFSFKKPLLLYKSLAELEEFKDISLSYDMENIIKILSNLDKNIIVNLKNNIENIKEFSWEYQKNRYQRILFE